MADEICRLCSSKNNLIKMFDENRNKATKVLRYFIWLATEIQIKETDIVSKMVCHCCCEIAVKLHKYRTNAIANDKLLKELCGQPYTPPRVTDQKQLLHVSSACNDSGNGNLMPVDSSASQDALELLRSAITNEGINKLLTNTASFSLPSSEQDLNKVSSVASSYSRLSVHRTRNSVTLPRTKITKSTTSASSNLRESVRPPTQKKLYENTFRVNYIHPSVVKLIREDTKVILPPEAFKTDISPVISLDSAEVSDWYDSQLNSIKQKLSHIIIKKIPGSSNYKTALSSVEPSDSNIETNHHVLKSIIPCENITNQRSKCNQSENDCNTDITCIDKPSECKDISSDLFAKPVDSCLIKPPQNTHKKGNTAKKKTSRKPYHTRKRPSPKKSNSTKIVPEKKRRIYSNNDGWCTPSEVDIPQQYPTVENVAKDIFISSLELIPNEPLRELIDSQNIMTTGKTLDVFMCAICSIPCFSKKHLNEHEVTHLTCKFCKTRFENVEFTKQHLNATCSGRRVQDNAVVLLTQVDSIPSIVKKYPKAFQAFNISKCSLSLCCNEDIVLYSDDETESSMNSFGHKDESTMLRQEIQNIFADSTTHAQRKPTIAFPPLQKSVNEKEMILSIFKKHFCEKCDSSAQTCTLNTKINYTNTNLIQLENMLPELVTYKIPIDLEFQPKINVGFKEGMPTTVASTFECWVHKKPVDVQNPLPAPVTVTNSATTSSITSAEPQIKCSVAPKRSMMKCKDIIPKTQTTTAVVLNLSPVNNTITPTKPKVTQRSLLKDKRATSTAVSTQSQVPYTIAPTKAFTLTNTLSSKKKRARNTVSLPSKLLSKTIVPRNSPAMQLPVSCTSISTKTFAPAIFLIKELATNTVTLTQKSLPETIIPRNSPASNTFMSSQSSVSGTTTLASTKTMATNAVAPKKPKMHKNIPKQLKTSNIVISSQPQVPHTVTSTTTTAGSKAIVNKNTSRKMQRQTVLVNNIQATNTAVFTQSLLPYPSTSATILRSTTVSIDALTTNSILSANAIVTSLNQTNILNGNTPSITTSLLGNQNNTGTSNTTHINTIPTYNILVPTTMKSSVNISKTTPSSLQCTSYNTEKQVQSANFMQLVHNQNTGGIQYQNNGNATAVNQTPSSNLVRIVETPGSVIHYLPVGVSQNNAVVAMDHTYHSQSIYQVRNNIPNANKLIVLSNNVPQNQLLSNNIQEAPVLSNTVYATSYLNTAAAQAPSSCEQSIKINEPNNINQPVSLMSTETNNQPVQVQNLIRVKNLCELRN